MHTPPQVVLGKVWAALEDDTPRLATDESDKDARLSDAMAPKELPLERMASRAMDLMGQGVPYKSECRETAQRLAVLLTTIYRAQRRGSWAMRVVIEEDLSLWRKLMKAWQAWCSLAAFAKHHDVEIGTSLREAFRDINAGIDALAESVRQYEGMTQ